MTEGRKEKSKSVQRVINGYQINNMKNLKVYNDGLVEDVRTDELKSRDYRKPETGLPITWAEKPESMWKHYIPRQQLTSLSCMSHAGAKAFETLNKKENSAHPVYRSRSNYPQSGMFLADLGSLYKNIGTTLESLDISQNQNEIQMNRSIMPYTASKVGGYFFVAPDDINAIAEVIEVYGNCILVIHGNRDEWTAIPEYNGLEENFGHGICIVDYFYYGGKKVLLAEDSTAHFASFDKNGTRLITEDYLKKRAAGAMYFVNEIPIPPFKFTQTMRLGNKGGQVQELQKFLNKFENVTLVTDGIFGNKTLVAVKLFQGHHNLVQDGIFGLKSRTVANLMI